MPSTNHLPEFNCFLPSSKSTLSKEVILLSPIRCRSPIDRFTCKSAPMRSQFVKNNAQKHTNDCSFFKQFFPFNKNGGFYYFKRQSTSNLFKSRVKLNNTDTKSQGSNTTDGFIAFKGAHGSHVEKLAFQLCPNLRPLPCAQYEDTFTALSTFTADRAIVPLETSTDGSNHPVFDFLLRYKIFIEKEIIWSNQLCLAANKGVKQKDITKIYGYADDFGQCNVYLKSHFPNVEQVAIDNCVEPSLFLTDSFSSNEAVVTNLKVAKSLNMLILEDGLLHTKLECQTRYVLISRVAAGMKFEGSTGYKTTIAFSFPEKHGQLFHCLSVFALRDINLTKIESRPFRDDPTFVDPILGRQFRYIFYLDLIGGLDSNIIQNSLVHLKEIAPFVKIIGSYAMDQGNMMGTESLYDAKNFDMKNQNIFTSRIGTENDLLLMQYKKNAEISFESSRLSVAYQGNPGAYSESAVLGAFPNAHPVPCETFEDVFQALSQYLVDVAVLPVENSLGGSIHAVYDLLLQYRLFIIGEVSLEVRHCLLANTGVKKVEIKKVISHYQALAQVDNYTAKMGVIREAVDDTAGAAKDVSLNGYRDVAAVASERAAQLYGLNILDKNIQDNKNNFTRFIILSRDPRVQTSSDRRLSKTSIVFCLKNNEAGELFKALSVFSLRGINLTKIESRPFKLENIKPHLSRHAFYIDFMASLTDVKGQNALRHLTELTTFLRVLGCYTADIHWSSK